VLPRRFRVGLRNTLVKSMSAQGRGKADILGNTQKCPLCVTTSNLLTFYIDVNPPIVVAPYN
ncbi:MAG: hypothetical protein ACR2PH_08670, partial [Desulfobulbia bacterium]